MAFYNKYPYTDFHELNLDWFLLEFKKVKDDFGTLEQTVQDFIDYVNGYFAGLDIQHEVTLRLNAMAADGTLSALIQPMFDAYKGTIDGIVADQNSAIEGQNERIATQIGRLSVLESRMDDFASLPPGSTAGNAELLDIRVGGNGVNFPSAGEAVRRQVNALGWFNAQQMYEGSDVREPINTTINGVYVVNDGGGKLHVNGTATTSSSITLVNTGGNGLPAGFRPGDKVFIYFNTPGTNFTQIRLFTCNDAGQQNWSFKMNISPSSKVVEYVLPNDCEGVLIWLPYTNGTTYNDDVDFWMLNAAPNLNYKEWDVVKSMQILPSGDLNYVLESGWYILASNETYTNKPTGWGGTGFLEVISFDNFCYQRIYHFSDATSFCRRGGSDGSSWVTWQQVSGMQTVNYNSNTYNVTASPVIGTDSNNYLASSGNSNDRTNDIASMLVSTGVCNLGPGEFYVKNLDMPAGSALRGSGKATRIVLSTGAGYAVKLGDGCTLEDVFVDGSAADIVLDGNIGNRDGILWFGTHSIDLQAPERAIVSNVYVHGFDGAAMRFYDTGTPLRRGVLVNNVSIWNCEAGIHTALSEYNKFTNVKINSCYFGAVNNGGNNVFTSCDFSGCTVGFVIDNSSQIYGNNGHGSCIGCIFNHIDNNTGIAVKMNNQLHGFTFTGCQFFFGRFELVNCHGVIVSSSVFGSANQDIEITGGTLVEFIGNTFASTPTITVSNNGMTHFVNNYNNVTGAVVQP